MEANRNVFHGSAAKSPPRSLSPCALRRIRTYHRGGRAFDCEARSCLILKGGLIEAIPESAPEDDGVAHDRKRRPDDRGHSGRCCRSTSAFTNRSPAAARCAWKNVVFPAPFGPAIATTIGRRSNSANSIRGMGPPGIPDRRIGLRFACHRHRHGPPCPVSRELADSGETAATRGIPQHAGAPQPNQSRPDTRTGGPPRRPAAGRVLGSLRAMVRSLGRVAPRTRSDQRSSALRSRRSAEHQG